MRFWILLAATVTSVVLGACRMDEPTCNHPDLARIDGSCMCRNGGRYICDAPDDCYCEDPASRGDSGAPADAGAPDDAGSIADAAEPDAAIVCDEATTLCGRECVDTRADAEHCGACDSPCAAPNQCSEGTCIDPVIDVEAGWWHTCALRASGTVWCWGSNDLGQLGDGTMIERHAPVQVLGVDDAVAIAVGGQLTRFPSVTAAAGSCALHATGEVSCWGSYADGATTPSRIAGLDDAEQLSAGGYHVCALRTGGAVVCWGANGTGQLGDGSLAASSQPVSVSGLIDAIAVSAGSGHSCAVRADGRVACWGAGTRGELGDGRASSTSTPVVVPDLANVEEVVAATGCTCSRSVSGEVLCWGSNTAGCLGGESTDEFSASPTALLVARDFQRLFDTSSGAMCGQRATGAVLCWGNSDSAAPTERSELVDVTDVSTSILNECVAWRDGSASCRGRNLQGQVGDGTTEPRDEFVRVLP